MTQKTYLIRYTDVTIQPGTMFTKEIRANTEDEARNGFSTDRTMAVFGKGIEFQPGALIWYIHKEG